jgi:tetratricopeptide (TPR) repeat protein
LIGREDSLQSVRAELSTFRPVYTVSGARGSGVSSFLRCLHDRLAEYNVVFVDAHWCPDFTTVAGELCTVLRMHAVQSLQASLEAWCAAQRAKIIVIIDAGQAELSHIVQSLSELAIGGNVMFVLGSTAASSLVADAYLGPLKSSDAIALMTNRAPYLQSRMDAAVDVLVVSPGAIAVLESPPPESFTSEEWTVAALLHHRPQPSTMDAIVLESLGGFSGPFGADIGAPVASVHRGVFVGMMDHFATLGFVEKCPPSRWRRAGATIGDVTPQNLTGFVRAFVVLSNVIERLCMAGVSTAAVSLLDRYSTDYQRFWKLCSGATELPDDAVKCLTGCDWRTAAAARLRLDEQLAVAAGIAAVTLRVAGETTQPFAKVTSWLAHVNAEKGAREPAVALYNQALTIARSIGANGVVADCLSGLAYSHVFSGDLPSALVLYKEAEAVQRAIQGPSHPDVAFALKNIGSVLHEQGELQAALEAYDAALTIERMRITLDISKTLAAKALILKKLGRVDACAAAYREAIDVRQRILGHCHQSVAVLQCAAANALFALQQYNDALDLYLAALSIQQQLLGQTHADVALLKSNIGSVLKHLKRYDEAVSAYQEAIAIKRTLHGARHVSVAVLLTSLAMVEVQRGNFGDALTLQQEALTIFSEANGPRAAEVGSALTNVAGILHKQGKLGDAMAVYSQALDVFSDGSGGYALGAAAVLIGMAKVHSDQKKLGLALQSLRQALKLQRSALGDAHVDVLTTKVNIADMLYGLSEFVEALDVCKDVVDTMGTGSELHNVLALTALQCMSRVLSKLGRHDEAVDVDREIVDAEKAVHGDCHPNVIAALCKLGEGEHACGQSAEAVEAYEAALDIVRATAGPSHPNVAVLLSVIANIHKEDGEFEEALAALQDALPIVEKLGGVDLAECLLDLAEAHEGLEHVSDAVDCYKRALGLLQTLPDKHRDLLASTYGSLAALFSALDRTAEADAMYKAEMDVLSTLGDQLALAAAMEEVAALRFDERRFDDALTEYHRALDVRKAAFGAFNADVAAVLSAIGFTEWRRGDHASALSFLQQALEMREATLGPLSLGVVTTLLAIGGVQNDAGKIHEAVLAWKRALHIQESLFGRQHAAVATTLSNIGFLCCDVGDYEQGLPALQQAVSLRSELCGRIHPDVLQLRVCLGDVLRKSGRHAEAHGQFRAAFDGYLETYGPDSPDAALCLALANACV